MENVKKENRYGIEIYDYTGKDYQTAMRFGKWRVAYLNHADRFDKAKCDHDHLVCQKCGKLKDVFLSGIADEIKNNSGDEIISYELNAYYICDSCK